MHNTQDRSQVPSEGGLSRLQRIEFFIAATAAALAVLTALVMAPINIPLWLTLAVSFVAWSVAGHAGAFKISISMSDQQVVSTVAIATLGGFVSTAVGEALLRQSVERFSYYAVASIAALASLSIGIVLSRHLLRTLWRADLFRTTAVVVGNEFTNYELSAELAEGDRLGIDVVGTLDLRDEAKPIAEIAAIASATQPDRIIIAGSSTSSDFALARTIDKTRARIYVVPQLSESEPAGSLITPHQLNGVPLLRVDRHSRQLAGGVRTSLPA